MSSIFRKFAWFLALAISLPAVAQQKTYTAADYARAEKFMGYNVNPLVYHSVRPAWLPDERVWFRDVSAEGTQFVILDPASGKREPAFDHANLAAALTAAAKPKAPYSASKLPFNDIEISEDGKSVSFSFGTPPRRYKCDRS